MILRAAWVFPVSSPPIRDGFVAIDANGAIEQVGPFDDSARRASQSIWAGRQLHDFKDAALIPGLVNPHTHLELTCYAGQLPRAPLWTWLMALVAVRRQPNQLARETAAVADGAWQSLRAGVTCVGDISRVNLAWRPLKGVPIRKVAFVELLSIADQPPRNPAELGAAIAEVIEDDLLTVGISPHAPYTVPADQIGVSARLAGEFNRPWCVHWAETPEEIAFLAGNPDAFPTVLAALIRNGGVKPYGLAAIPALRAALAGQSPRGILAHCNYLTDADINALAEHAVTVVYCPRAHQFYGHVDHPWRRLRAAGIRVALGTDSLAANESLSPLDEATFLWSRRTAADDLRATDLLRMITLDAAAGLDLDASIGSLQPGKRADLAAYSLDESAKRATTGDEVLAALFSAPLPAAAVFVNGKQVIPAARD